MIMTTLILILATIYLLSVFGMYKTTKFLHEKGRWNMLSPDFLDVVLMFAPFFNTVFCIVYLLIIFCDKPIKKHKPSLASRIFRIKSN